MLRGEIQKNAVHGEKELNTYGELRAVDMKWAINRILENERFLHDPVGWNRLPPAA